MRATAKAPSRTELARAIYDALTEANETAFMSEYRPGRVTIDGRFNLSVAAALLRDRFWPDEIAKGGSVRQEMRVRVPDKQKT